MMHVHVCLCGGVIDDTYDMSNCTCLILSVHSLVDCHLSAVTGADIIMCEAVLNTCAGLTELHVVIPCKLNDFMTAAVGTLHHARDSDGMF